jgi:hypothetical protein
MAWSAHTFFAGVGTTFLILGVGFGGGMLMANSALKEPAGYQAKAKAEPAPPARVILPTTAETAQSPQAPQPVAAVEPAPVPQAAPVEPAVEKVDTKKAEKQERDRKKRIAERKAKRQLAQTRARQHEPRQEARIMAFDVPPQQTAGINFFGN